MPTFDAVLYLATNRLFQANHLYIRVPQMRLWIILYTTQYIRFLRSLVTFLQSIALECEALLE